jgi:hypothetical protein
MAKIENLFLDVDSRIILNASQRSSEWRCELELSGIR